MTEDIVKRLRYCAEHGLIDAAKSELAAGYGEAAEEIERLRDGVRATIQERDILSGENWDLRAENDALRAATGSLVRSLSGSWDAFEPSLRREMGNTNYHCVKEKMEEVEALLNLRAAKAALGESDE